MCDTFVVVEPGHVLFAKNSDRDPNEAQALAWVAAGDHAPGAELHCTWRRIPQLRHTHALILSRPYWMWGAEMGVNQHGVAIGNEAVFTNAGFDADGLTGMDLVRLGLERASSAEEATEVIRALLAAYGQGGRCGYTRAGFRYHSSFLIADRYEAWVLETAGRDCAVERITHGVRAISNGITLPALRPRARRLHEYIAAAHARRARVECLAASVRETADAARALADHGADTSLPRYRWSNGALQAPCVHAGGLLAASQTVASWISVLEQRGDRHWATGTSAPCMTLFRPLEFARPRASGQPTGAPDGASLWWRFERLHRAMLRDPAIVPASFAQDRQRTQAAIFATPDVGWDLAEDWLARWESWAGPRGDDARPWWLRRYWRGVEKQAAGGPLLPWRDA